ncbi:MAG: glycine cleavage system aminomethyltransferase GcvT [Rhodospirillales bacterium]
MDPAPSDPLKTTALDALHRSLGARMVPFAGYAMPVQYEGIIAEHLHTRDAAGLFDVSHMGQAILHGDDPARALEALVPADLRELAPHRQRYTMLTNDRGGILDDLMVARGDRALHLVVNAACKENDFAHIAAHLGTGAELEILNDRALLALQGPAAAAVLARHAPASGDMAFMTLKPLEIAGIACWASRSGYTGEDGFEISVPDNEAERLARLLLDEPDVKPIGLGARDSLRLEAGLCLYGNDIDETTTPIEARLSWTVGKRRRREGGFPGDAVILQQLRDGAARKRVGFTLEGRAPVRAHTKVLDRTEAEIGEVTSGGFSPSLNAPIAMGYVGADHAEAGQSVSFPLRGKIVAGGVARLPFVKHRYHAS